MSSPVPVTIQDVARAAGVSRAAVSMGLRDHPRISAATRLRILAAAARLGYRPDPAISHLMSYMRKRLKPTPPSALAYLTDRYPDDWMNGHLGAVYQGAKTRAAALGYHLEILSLTEPGMTGRRMASVLRARGIEGVLIGPLVVKGDRLDLDCSDLSTVVLSGNIWQPPLHRVHSDYHFNMLSMLRRLTQLGYRRVGLVTNAIGAHHIEHQEEGAFLAATQRFRRQDRPILCLPRWQTGVFQKWFQQYRPEAVVTGWLDVIPALQAIGVNVPGGVGVVFNWIPEGASLSGVRQDFQSIGAAGLDLLDLLLRGHEKGYPTQPKTMLIRGTWMEGTTVRKIRPA